MDFRLYRQTDKSNLLQALTLNDATIWGADIFVSIIFALYVTQVIPGGSAIHVGFIFGLYRGIRALTSIPIGRFLDKHQGHVDEFNALLFSNFLATCAYLLLFLTNQLWLVYIGMAVIAVAHAIDVSSWRILFYSNLPRNEEGKIIGIYETAMQIVYGLSIIVAGFIGATYGFNWTLLFAAVLTLLGSFALLVIKDQSKSF